MCRFIVYSGAKLQLFHVFFSHTWKKMLVHVVLLVLLGQEARSKEQEDGCKGAGRVHRSEE